MIKKKAIQLVWIMGVISLASCTGGTSKLENGNKVDTVEDAFLRSVKTCKVAYSNEEEELTLNGKVEYDQDKVISYVSLVNGIAERTFCSLGDKVQKGQTLLTIRSAELNSLRAEMIASESEIKVAQREWQTAQTMHADNMLSEKELLEAQAKLKQAQAAYDKIHNDISMYGVGKNNGSFSIPAPASGYIVDKNISSGSTVSPDSGPLFTIADLSKVWITANVYATNLQFVKEGMEVEITTLSYPDELFHGQINSLSQVFDPEEKVLKARIVMDNKSLKLKPEMSVVVKLKSEKQTRCTSIPSDALIFDKDHYFVIVETSAGKFTVREVLLKGHNGQTTYVASGLLEGENVVINNQLLIYTGLKEK
ncbi:MAG TPA: efflux RND transporter periplasmic adaptor subunit [Bacteroides reticulotermitis]|nr:efflux RND transporter periplasmic adaptor subunit [Bacteroides reticulotermitis]